MEIDDRPLTVYRIVKTFPPDFDREYTTSEKRFNTSRQPDNIRRASAGLSVFRSFKSVVNQQAKYPMLGTLIVRYRIPSNSPVAVWHLTGSEDHWTVFCDPPSKLHDYLDSGWVHETI